jgi:hypothetical protein
MKNQSLLRENFRMKFFIAAAFVFLFNPFLQAHPANSVSIRKIIKI